jgi:hypothetical protein
MTASWIGRPIALEGEPVHGHARTTLRGELVGIFPGGPAAGRSMTEAEPERPIHAPRCDGDVPAADRRRLGQLRQLLVDVDVDGWDSSSGREVLRLIRRECVAESCRWINRAGHLGEVGVAPVWVALAVWMSGHRRADPVGVLRVTARRVYAAEAAGVELCMGDPVNRPRPLVQAATGGRGPRRTDVDLDLHLAADADRPVDVQSSPAWLQVTAEVLRRLGWAWPQSPSDCLAAVAAELPTTGRRAAPAMARHETGVPPATWSALALLAGGSGPGCAEERVWPGVPRIHDVGGAEAVRRSAEVRRIGRAAVAGRPVRSGRAWLLEEQRAS